MSAVAAAPALSLLASNRARHCAMTVAGDGGRHSAGVISTAERVDGRKAASRASSQTPAEHRSRGKTGPTMARCNPTEAARAGRAGGGVMAQRPGLTLRRPPQTRPTNDTAVPAGRNGPTGLVGRTSTGIGDRDRRWSRGIGEGDRGRGAKGIRR
ncbi:hypothetical protein KEM55_006760 [Ascosphaera atra]|nr:hypothetical protein KEM55_006760 [Ascosphaera atra]